jgi:ATP-dependent NAD(P)H-hydrate dehydratase
MFQKDSTSPDSRSVKPAKEIAQPIIALFPRLHVLVVGPGLGRDELMQSIVTEVLIEAKKEKIPIIIDADGLYLIQQNLELVKGWEGAVLTPNVAEFSRLWKAAGLRDEEREGDQAINACATLAKKLGGVTIIQKGAEDIIAQADSQPLIVSHQGGLKRSSGQGDLLTGSLATFLAWRKAYHEGGPPGQSDSEKISEHESLGLAVYAASTLVRETSRRAFQKHRRSMVASDMLEEVAGAFEELFGEEVGDSKL